MASLTQDKKRPMSRSTLAVIGVSVLAHAGLVAWLYNQNYTIDQPPEVVEPPATTLTLWRPPAPPTPTPQTQAPRQPTPIHTPPTVIETPIPPLPIPAPLPTSSTSTSPGPILTIDHGGGVEGGTGTAPSPTPAPSVIRNPDWVSRPTAAQMERFYPRRAAENVVGGSATLSCVVTATGSVSNCAIQSETPAGMGFGSAAQRLSQYFRLSPRTVDGAPVEGARVTIPLTFGLGD